MQAGAPPAPHLADSSALPVAPLSELEVAEQTAKVIGPSNGV